MLSIDKMTLIAGADIQSPELGVIFSQPTLKEIASALGEGRFIGALEALNIKVEKIKQDISEEITDFELLLYSLSKDKARFVDVTILLSLALKKYDISITDDLSIALVFRDNKEIKKYINKDNYKIFLYYLNEIYYLERADKSSEKEYNTISPEAARIAEKIAQGKAKRKPPSTNTSLFENSISILAEGLKVPLNNILELTLPQFFNQYKRFCAHEEFEQSANNMRAGATEVVLKNWRDSL